MTYKYNDYENTHGTNITIGNSDDGGCTALAVSTSGTRTYDNTWSHSGSTSAKCYGAAGTGCLQGFSGGTEQQSRFRGYFYMPTLPASTVDILQWRPSSGVCGALSIMADGKFRLTDKDGVVATSTATLSATTAYRVEYRVKAVTTSTGEADVAIYAGDSLTPVEEFNYTDVNFGTGPIDANRWGKITDSGSPAWTLHWDDVAVDDGTDTDYIGPLGDGLSEASATLTMVAELDCTDSVGTVSVTQTFGDVTMAVTEPSTGVFRVVLTPHKHTLRFEVEADGDGDPVTTTVDVPPDNLAAALVFVGGDYDDWANYE